MTRAVTRQEWLALTDVRQSVLPGPADHASLSLLPKLGRDALLDVLTDEAEAILSQAQSGREAETPDDRCVVGSYTMGGFPGTLAIGARPSTLTKIMALACGGMPDGVSVKSWPPSGSIERELTNRIVDRFAQSIEMAVSSLGKALVLRRTESPPLLEWETYLASAPFRSLKIVDDRIVLALPDAIARELFEDNGVGQLSCHKAMTDSQWSARLRANLNEARVTIEVVVVEKDILVAEIQRLRVGYVLTVDAPPGMKAILMCDGHRLFDGRLSQSDGRYMVRVISGSSAEWKPREARMENLESAARATESIERTSGASSFSSVLGRVPVTLQVVLGAATMSVADVSALDQGAVVPLNRRIGEQVDILVNGRQIGKGDICVTGEGQVRFAVTITELREASLDGSDGLSV